MAFKLARARGLHTRRLANAHRRGAQLAAPGRRKWRLGIVEYTFWASIEDELLERVDRDDEGFRKGDVLRCLIEIVQTRDAEGLHTDHRVLEVREHLPRALQMRLDEPPTDGD